MLDSMSRRLPCGQLPAVTPCPERDRILSCLRLSATLHAHQHLPKEPGATRFGRHPLSDLPRGIMSHVLGVPTLELGDPMSLVVLMKSDDPFRNSGFRFSLRVHLTSGDPAGDSECGG